MKTILRVKTYSIVWVFRIFLICTNFYKYIDKIKLYYYLVKQFRQ